MSPRKIFEDEAEQRQHEENCASLQRALFSGSKGRSIVEEELRNHPAREVHQAILDLRVKYELLIADLEELSKASDEFWKKALRPGSDHAQECGLQRGVWRRAFHVAHATESLTESVLAAAKRFAKRKRMKGSKNKKYEFAIPAFEARWRTFKDSPLVEFNWALRGRLFHSCLINPDWMGHIDFESGGRRERFLLKKSVLYSSMEWKSKARQYIERNSVASDGSRGDARREAIGVDLLDHYGRYAKAIGELVEWFIGELSSPRFGVSLGFDHHALDEYLDWRVATTPSSAPMTLCGFCGHPYTHSQQRKTKG